MGLAKSAVDEFGRRQNMNHRVDMWPLTKLKANCNESMVWKIYGVEDDMVNWLETSVTTALAE